MPRRVLNSALVLILLALVTSCVTPPSAPPSEWRSDTSYFTDAQRDFRTLNKWLYKAKVGVTTSAGREAASMVWEFADQANTVRLFGPLGVGAIKLQFDQYGVVLSDNKGVLHRGRSAQLLLDKIVGWPIPVDALSYWLFLVPQPDVAYRYQVDEQQQLKILEQLGWRIEYSSYQDFDGHQLPRKMKASRTRKNGETVSVRLVSKDWQWPNS